MSIESPITKDPGFTQKACHDLESFLYIILYLCTFMNGPGLVLSKEVPNKTPMHSWFNNNAHPSSTSYIKAGHMLCPDLSNFPYFTEYWEDLKPYVLRLIQTCFPENSGQPNHLMHNKMVSILPEALEVVEEPKRPKASDLIHLEMIDNSRKANSDIFLLQCCTIILEVMHMSFLGA